MSKVDEYIRNMQDVSNVKISIKNGKCYVEINYYKTEMIGEIERIELAIEVPDATPNIYRVESVRLFNEDDELLYDDQNMVNNDIYFDQKSVVEALAKNYGVLEEIIGLI